MLAESIFLLIIWAMAPLVGSTNLVSGGAIRVRKKLSMHYV